MPSQKLEQTRYEGIYSYKTKKGLKYAIRVTYRNALGDWKEKPEH